MFDFYSQMGLYRKKQNIPIIIVPSPVQKPQPSVLPLVEVQPITKKQNGGFKIVNDVNNNSILSKNVQSVQKVLPKNNNKGGFKIVN